MINLLPLIEQQAVQKEYRFRVLVVALAFVISLIVLALILLVPSFILVWYKGKVAQDALGMPVLAKDARDHAAFDAKLNEARATAQALKPDAVRILPSDIISFILKDETADNAVTSLSYIQKPKEPFKMSVKGVAKSRESLQTFTKALQKESLVASVDLPVSNFTQDSDIDFSLVIQGK